MKTSPIRALLVMPDTLWAQRLFAQLQQDGFTPMAIVSPSSSLLGVYQSVQLNLVLFDLDAFGEGGLSLCHEIRYLYPDIKIVLVTENDHAVPSAALQIGVAGCIHRDFPLAEWSGVLTYILRGGAAFSRDVLEVYLAQARFKAGLQPLVTIGGLQIDLTRRLVTMHDRRICLTPREFALLACLAKNVDQVVTFDQILDEAWGYDAENGEPTQVRHYIARLRRKLVATSEFIVSERSIGYRLSSAALCKEKMWSYRHLHKNGVAFALILPGYWLQQHFDNLVNNLNVFDSLTSTLANWKKRLAEQWAHREHVQSWIEHEIMRYQQAHLLEERWLYLLSPLHAVQEHQLVPLGDFLIHAIHLV